MELDTTSSELEAFRNLWKSEVEARVRYPTHKTTQGQRKTRENANDIALISPEEPGTESDSPLSHDTDVQASTAGTTRSTGHSQSVENHSTSTATVMTALEVYQLGAERERQGALSDALLHYRTALKMDPSVEKLAGNVIKEEVKRASQFEEDSLTLEGTNYARFIQTKPDYDPSNTTQKNFDSEHALADTMITSRISIVAEDPDTPCGMSLLPEEILQHVLTYALVSSPVSFTALSLVCPCFYILLHDQSIWREVCQSTYYPQTYAGHGEEAAVGESRSSWTRYMIHLEEEYKSEYASDWLRMYMHKPRIRFNGIYISTCHYTRPGVREESLTWTVPVHLVTYFRYLRFFPEGHCLTLLTTVEPKDVVHDLTFDTKMRGVQTGKWMLTKAGALSIQANGPARYVFTMELQVKSSSRGKQNKLTWKGFYGVHPQTAEVTNFNLKNDKSYYYSRVKSYGRA